MEIGAKIQKLRLMKGITQEQLAEVLGVTVQTVSRWENSVTLPDVTTLPGLASFFHTTTDYLLCMEASARRVKLLRTIETFELSSREDAEALLNGFRNESFPRLADWTLSDKNGAFVLEVTKDFDIDLEQLRFAK